MPRTAAFRPRESRAVYGRLRERGRAIAIGGHGAVQLWALSPPGPSGAKPPPAQSGSPVLLLHGFAQNRRSISLGPLPHELMRRGARVFLGELRGHGGAPGHMAPGVRAYLAHDVPALVEAVARESGQAVHLWGHSLGGILGYLLADTALPLRSVVGFGAPLVLGAGHTRVRTAAILAAAMRSVWGERAVPVDWALHRLAEPLAHGGGLWNAVRSFTQLVERRGVRHADIARVLRSSETEGPGVFFELVGMAATRRPVIAGLDIEAAVRRARCPVAAVVGATDIFAPPASVRAISSGRHAGPRRVFSMPAAHVDILLSRELRTRVDAIWRFAEGTSA